MMGFLQRMFCYVVLTVAWILRPLPTLHLVHTATNCGRDYLAQVERRKNLFSLCYLHLKAISNEDETTREASFAKFLSVSSYSLPPHCIKDILCGQFTEKSLVLPNFRFHPEVIFA